MTDHIKKIFISALSAFVLIAFVLVHAVEVFNSGMRIPALRSLLVEYLQSVIHGTASADSVRIFVGNGTGIAFHGVGLEVRGKYMFAADEAVLVYSIISRVQRGYWLKELRLVRPHIHLRADGLGNAARDSNGSLPELVIEDPDITLYLEGHALTLKGGFHCRISSMLDSEGKARVSGIMNFRDTIVLYDDDQVSVRGMVVLEKGIAHISGLSILSGKATVAVSGRYEPGAPGKFSGSVHLEQLELGSGDGGSAVLSTLLGLVAGTANLTARNIKLFGIPVERASASAEAGKGALRIQGIRATGKLLSGEGAITVGVRSPLVFDVHFELKNYDAGEILSPASGSPPLVKGPINLKGRLWGTGDSINGDLSFSSFNGLIKRYDALSRIFSALNIYKLILSRNPGMEERGFQYNSIVAHAVILDSMISINDLYLDSNSVQVSGVGTYNIRSGIVDMMLGMRMLESFDVVINAIPIFGWVVRGRDKGFFVMDLKVTGTLDDLSAQPVPIRSISRRVGDIIIKTLMLPYVFFTRPASLIPGLTEKK